MAVKITIYALAALVCQVYSQCGCGPALRPPPLIPPPLIPRPVFPPPVVTTSDVVATTVIDNSVSNSLANAIQLLIVSKLIESTMNSNIVSPATPLQSPIAYPIDVTIPPVFPTPVPEIIPNYGCGDAIEVIPTMYGVPEFLPIQNPCGVTEILTPNVVPNPFNEGYGGSIPPFEVNPFAPMFGGFDYPVPTIGPFAADVLFPPSIPAQLRCNFGYSPTNVPFVSYTVEPVPFGNGFFI